MKKLPNYKLLATIEEAAQDEREAIERYINLARDLSADLDLQPAIKQEAIRICEDIAAMEMEHSEWLVRLSSLLYGVYPSRELMPNNTVPQGSWPPNTAGVNKSGMNM